MHPLTGFLKQEDVKIKKLYRKMERYDTTTSLYINIKSRKQFYSLIFLSFILYHKIVKSLSEIDSSL